LSQDISESASEDIEFQKQMAELVAEKPLKKEKVRRQYTIDAVDFPEEKLGKLRKALMCDEDLTEFCREEDK